MSILLNHCLFFNDFYFIEGNKIAEYEMKTLTVKMLSQYKIELKEGYEPDISWDVVLKPYNGVWVRLVSRN